MEVMGLKQGKLVRMARGLLFRRKMMARAKELENKIRAFLLKEGKEEVVSGGLKISVREDGRIEIVELPPLTLEQMELPITQSEGSKKGGKNTKIDIVKIHMVKDRTIEYGKKPINNPQALAELGLKFLKNADREIFILVCLNTKNYVNCIQLLTIGTLDRAVIAPREVVKAALLSNSAAVAFIHNHPSGDPEPSSQDVNLTRSLAGCAEIFDIRVLDHVIVTDEGRYESFLEKRLLKPAEWQPGNK
jgi:DNA repair protein RadC